MYLGEASPTLQEGQLSNTIKFQLPRLPPSINSLYNVIYSQRRIELKPEARHWKSGMKQYVPRFVIAESSLLRIDFVFHYPFLYQNGRLRIFDSPNLIKLAIDCICEKLAIQDARVKSGSWESVDEEREFVEVVLSEVVNEHSLHQTTNNRREGAH